jgi:hypothetical protein
MTSPFSDDNALLLFNNPKYHQLNLTGDQSLFRYDHWVEDRWVGSLIGVKTEGIIDCGYKAPYGGPDIVRAGESTTEIIQFLRDAVASARQTGAKTLRIRARPAYHSANEASVLFALFNLGFSVESCEFSQGIDVTRYSSAEHYIRELKDSQRNQIRRGLSQTEFSEAETEEDWGIAYELLSLNRSFRALTLKFSLAYLLQLRAVFPQRLSMYLLRAEDRPIAAALVYRVRPKIDHIVSWGDDKTRRENAPVGTIAVHLLERAIREKVEILDIGISSVDGIPDDGLIAFKRHTLATSDLRLTFVRALGLGKPPHLT